MGLPTRQFNEKLHFRNWHETEMPARLLISTPEDLPNFRHLLGDGSHLGIKITYREQPRPEGLAQAYIVGADFVRGGNSALILGDNIFFGHGMSGALAAARARPTGATVFAYQVSDPSRYGVVELNAEARAVSIAEKPSVPKSKWAVTGLYFFDQRITEIATCLKPSARGELEITDAIAAYLDVGELHVARLGRGFAWFDTGTPDSMLDASEFMRTLEKRQGFRVSCPEEIAFRMQYISRDDLAQLGRECGNSDYGRYLLAIAEEEAVN
jgi:glucose-1-phosphate thymidylyltransferase